MDDYTLDRSRMLYSMEAALQPQLRPTFSDIGRSSIGTTVVDPTYQNRFFQGPLPLGGGASLPFLGSMFTSSLPPASHYRGTASNIVNMRQFWPPTPPPDAYSRCAMNGSLYPLYSSIPSLTPSSDSTSPYSSQPILPHLATTTPFTHLLEAHKESPFLSPSLSLSSPLPPTHQLTNSAPYLPIPPSPILDRHPVYGSLPSLGIKGLELPVPKSGPTEEDPTTTKEVQESNVKSSKREIHLERNCRSEENRSRRSRDGVKVAAVKGREKTEDTKQSHAKADGKKTCETTSNSSIPAVMTATVSPSVIHGSQRAKATVRSLPLEEGVKVVKETTDSDSPKANTTEAKPNTAQVYPVTTTVVATSTATTTSVTYSSSTITDTIKPPLPCASVTVTSTCSTSKLTNSTADTSQREMKSPDLAGKETQAISTFSTWVHHQTSITTVTNTRKTCYTSEGDCCSLTKQLIPEPDGSSQPMEAVNLCMDKIQLPSESTVKKEESPGKKENRNHEKKTKVSVEGAGVFEQSKAVAIVKEGIPPSDHQESSVNPQTTVFKGSVVSKKVENLVYTESWSNHAAVCLKDERKKKSECEFSKNSIPKTVETKFNVQSQAMNLSIGSKSVKTEQPENANSAESRCSHVYFDRFSEPGVESVSSSHSLSALSRLASSASNQMFTPSNVSPVPWSGKGIKPSSMVSSVQSETMRLSQTSKSPTHPASNSSLVICAGPSPSEPLPDKAKATFDCGKSIELKRKSLCTSGNTLLAVHETSSTVLALTSSVGCPPAHNSIPVGIAVAQQRQEPTNSKRGNTSEAEYFPVACQPQIHTDSAKSGSNTIQTELKIAVSQPSATSILVNQGTSISATQWDSDTIIRAPLQNSWLAQTPVVTPTVWLGQGTYATSAPAPTQTMSGIPLDSSHMPLPPVGYQLARDPLSGHIFLIPATNLELPVVDRPSLWSAFTPGTVQQLVTSTPHFQQGFQSTNDREHLNITEKQNKCPTNIKQEPCSLVAQLKDKLENQAEGTAEVLQQKQEVKDIKPITTAVHPSVTSIAIQSGQPFTISGFTTSATPTLSYYYESPTIVHLTQPTTAAIQTEPGKRSQGTSPLNPVTPSPPPEPSLDQDDTESTKGETVTAVTTMAIQVDLDACTTSDDNEFEERKVEVLDSANQTDAVLSDTAKEESEDELTHEFKEESSINSHKPQQKHFINNNLDILEESAPVLPTESKPVMDFIDHHGLDLLVDSIEEFASREHVKENYKANDEECEPEKMKEDHCDSIRLCSEADSQVIALKPAVKSENDTDSYSCNLEAACTDGLGLLCALAEQRFLEESQKYDQKSVEDDKMNLDINQNYQVNKKEAKSKNFPLPKLPISQPLGTVLPVVPICMDPAELEMRERLADLQRKYKQKQKELARLKPKKEKEDPDCKKSPGRTKKNHFPVFSTNFAKKFAMFRVQESATQDKNSLEVAENNKLNTGCSVSSGKQKIQKKKNSHSIIKCHVLTKQKVEKAVLSAQVENGFDATKFAQQQRTYVKEKPPVHKRESTESMKNVEDSSVSNDQNAISAPCFSSDSDDDKLLIDLQRKNSCEKNSPGPPSIKTEDTSNYPTDKSPTKDVDIHDRSQKPAPVCDGALGILAECASFFTNGNKRKANKDFSPDNKEQPLKKLKTNVKDEVTETKDDVVKVTTPESNPKPKKSKSAEKTKKRPSVDEDPWNRRRSERIFLHDAGVTLPSDLAFNTVDGMTSAQSKADSDSNKFEFKINKSKIDESTKSKKINLKRESSSSKKGKSKDSKKKKEKAVPDELSIALKHCRLSENSNANVSSIQYDSSSSEGDVPLSQLAERSATTELRSCKLKSSDLHDNLRVLTREEGLYYAGYITAIEAPDVYGITLDGERCNRPRILSREELLNEAILEVKPTNVNHIPIGRRVCAFWSQQYRCLYPGKVAKWKKSVGGPVQDSNMVFVEFDDGDSGRIPLEDIRLLPKNIPVQNSDPEPLLLLGKKRQRSTSESQTDQKSSLESDEPKAKHKKSKKLCKMGGKETKSSSKSNKSSKESSKETPNSASLQSFDALSVFTDSASCTSFNSSCSSNKPNQKKKSKKIKSESKSKSKPREECSSTTDDSSSSGASIKPKKHKKHKTEHKHRHHHHRHHCHHSHHHKKRKHEKKQNLKPSGASLPDAKMHSVPPLKVNDSARSQVTENKKSELCVKIKSPSHNPVIEMDSPKVNGQTESNGLDSNANKIVGSTNATDTCKKDKSTKRPAKRKERTVSVEKSKIAAFLPARQLWGWSGKSFRRHATKGKAKKEFFRAITRGKEYIRVGDCAVFLSTGRPHLPYVGRIETMWQSWGGNMVVRVKWFYHPEETKGGKKLADPKGALFQSPHADENDVQTISHKCEVLSFCDYKKWRDENEDSNKYGSLYDNDEVYYLAGTYEPLSGVVTLEPGVS